MNDILVLGGSNIDYVATSRKAIVWKDSNIGHIRISYGGVGRNVVENLARLRNRVTFLTGLSDDVLSLGLKKELEELGAKVLSPRLPYPTGSYVAVNDDKGEMQVAVCDSDFMDHMKLSDLLPFDSFFRQHRNIVLEANLNAALIHDLVERYPDRKFFAEGVSANKVGRFLSVLPKLTLFKSNTLEASYLLGTKEEPRKLVEDILETGCANVVLTQGASPIVYGSRKEGLGETEVLPCNDIVSVNGAGDSLFAGLIHGLSHGQSLKESIRFGARMSFYTLHSPSAVDPHIDAILEEFPWSKKEGNDSWNL